MTDSTSTGRVFTESHEWLLIEGQTVTVGITDHAQEQLGDIVFIELPEIGAEMFEGDELAVIESVKAAGDISMPVSGTILEVNEDLTDNPELVNEEPMDAGWFCRIKVDGEIDSSGFLDEEAYQALIEE